MKHLIIVLFLLIFITKTNSQSIHFEPISWQQALAKARQENKMLFVEMYTNWCVYCKKMEQTVFTNSEAGDFYNKHFINVRYNAQQSDGIQIHKSYALPGLPTFLYLDANGIAILKTAGYQEKETFIHNGDSALILQQNKTSVLKQKASNQE